MNRHPFIVIEGMDGTGKSTVVNRLATALGAHAVASVPAQLVPMRAGIDASASLETRYAFYRFAVSSMADEIAHLLVQRPVVCDRWIYSTVAYHAALGLDIDEDEVAALAAMPDHAFLLTACNATRGARIDTRAEKTRADCLFLDAGLGDEVAARLIHQGLHCIDTDALDASGVVQAIASQLGGSRSGLRPILRQRWDATPMVYRPLPATARQGFRYFS